MPLLWSVVHLSLLFLCWLQMVLYCFSCHRIWARYTKWISLAQWQWPSKGLLFVMEREQDVSLRWPGEHVAASAKQYKWEKIVAARKQLTARPADYFKDMVIILKRVISEVYSYFICIVCTIMQVHFSFNSIWDEAEISTRSYLAAYQDESSTAQQGRGQLS